MARNVAKGDDLGRYPDARRHQETGLEGKMAIVRQRLESGYYLSDEVASATAARMLQSDTDRPHMFPQWS